MKEKVYIPIEIDSIKNKKNLIVRQVSTKNIDTICYNLYIGRYAIWMLI